MATIEPQYRMFFSVTYISVVQKTDPGTFVIPAATFIKLKTNWYRQVKNRRTYLRNQFKWTHRRLVIVGVIIDTIGISAPSRCQEYHCPNAENSRSKHLGLHAVGLFSLQPSCYTQDWSMLLQTPQILPWKTHCQALMSGCFSLFLIAAFCKACKSWKNDVVWALVKQGISAWAQKKTRSNNGFGKSPGKFDQ